MRKHFSQRRRDAENRKENLGFFFFALLCGFVALREKSLIESDSHGSPLCGMGSRSLKAKMQEYLSQRRKGRKEKQKPYLVFFASFAPLREIFFASAGSHV